MKNVGIAELKARLSEYLRAVRRGETISDRLRLRTGLADADVASRRATILALIDSLEVVDIDSTVLDRAAQPMPTELGTLDAIHLATALLWKDMTRANLVMATHDSALALGAQAQGLPVVGVATGPSQLRR